MYIPIMKNRDEEMRVLENMNSFFSNSIIPLIEIYRDFYKINYLTDGSGKFLTEPKTTKTGKILNRRIPLEQTEEDIITLNKIVGILKEKKVFIDFFRFSESEYGNKPFNNIELSIRLSRDFEYYKERVYEITRYDDLIPVISIKEEFEINNSDLIEMINFIHSSSKNLAIRITDDIFDNYKELLEQYLSSEDYLMLDFREQNIDSKIMELTDFRDLDTHSKKIILNCPRSRTQKNSEFEQLQFTKNINNKAATVYLQYNLHGFGDFGGLKDDLPVKDAGSNGMGTALALLFCIDKNEFYSIKNENSSLGMSGYELVRELILDRIDFLDPDNSCIAIKRIKSMEEKFGSWSTWNNITLTRYIQQQASK